jgi:HlyD family secretion protein
MHQAENAVQQAVVAAEEARKAELIGIQAAEQQVTQAQAAAEKLRLPPDQAQVAAARAGIAQALAAQARLQPEPTDTQKAIASAGIAQALAMLDQARLNREYAEIRAPFDGVVAARNVDPGDPAASAGPAIVLVDIARLYVELAISDVDIGRVALGQRAEVRADALPGQVFGGKVGYVAPTATQQGAVRSYLVRVALNEHAGLRPGMSVRVDLDSSDF